MKVLVTGANGMLGRDLCPMLEDEGFDVIETDIHNLDITKMSDVQEFFKKEEPDFIIHCAAYTNVDKAEQEKDTADLINVQGTKNLALTASKLNIPIVYISTDYVFDGTKTSPYLPSDHVSPLNVYGLTKLKGEEAVKEFCKKYYIARTSWLYGHHGKNFVETMIDLSKKAGQIKIVDDQTGCPTWTAALCEGIIRLITEQKPYGTYHVCGGGKTTWFGFANEIFRIANIKTKTIPVTTEEFLRPAKRPKYSVMDNDKICPDWKVSLKKYMELRDDD